MALRTYNGRWEWWEDDLTMPRIKRMYRDMQKHPPLHLMIQGFLEIEGIDVDPENMSIPGESVARNIEAFMQAFPSGSLAVTHG